MSDPKEEEAPEGAPTQKEEKGNNADNHMPNKGAARGKGSQLPEGGARCGVPRSRIPSDVFAEAKLIPQGSNIPISWAIAVAQGKKKLSQQLQALRLREEVNSLVAQGLVPRRHAIEVFKGNLPLEGAKFEVRLWQRKHDQVYCRCHFEDFVAGGIPLGLPLVGRRFVHGTVVSNQKYVVVAKTENEELTLSKHAVKFWFPAEARKTLVKLVSWGAGETVLEPGRLENVKKRVYVKARISLKAMEEG